MAEVAAPSLANIDSALRVAAVNWVEIDEVRLQWAELDAADKEGYHMEWWVGAHRPLEALRAWEREGLLTDDQRARLADLQPLIQRNEAFLASVFAEK